jgi:hypothetical protein
MKLFTRIALLAVLLTIFSIGPMTAYAAENHEQMTIAHHLAYWDNLGKALNLSTDQQAKLNTVKEAVKAYWDGVFSYDYHAHDVFKNDCKQPTQNFDKIGHELKTWFQNKINVSHDQLVDAKVAFFKSLNAKQRQIVANFKD